MLSRPIDRVADPLSANVRGAAFVAAVGLGKLKVEEISSRVPIEKRYMPNRENRPIYDELFGAFLESTGGGNFFIELAYALTGRFSVLSLASLCAPQSALRQIQTHAPG